MGSNFSHLKNLPPDPSVGVGRVQFDDPVEQITYDLGGYYSNGTGRIHCPNCGEARQVKRGQKHNATLKRTDRGGLLFHCFKNNCSFESLLAALRSRGIKTGQAENAPPMTQAAIAERKAKQAEHDRKTLEKAHRIWASCRPIIEGDHVWKYFKNRGLSDEAIREVMQVGDVQAHNNLYWGFDDAFGAHRSFPAFVARITRPDGTFSIHRTFLDMEGRKAPVSNPRLALGQQLGGLVMLANRPGGKVCIAEGIETAMSLMSGLVPDFGTVFAGISAPNMEAGFVPLSASDTREIVYYADGEDRGRKAANRAASNLARTRPQNPVKVFSAPDGLDFNDILITELRERGLI